MALPEFPADLRRFILTSIPSVPYLEAVLLLRAEPQRAWDTADVARRLYLPEPRAAELIEQLVGAGVASAQQPGRAAPCSYGPVTPELAAMLERVAQRYAIDLMGVTDLIHSRIDKKAQQFADAFRWRKDD